MHTRLQVVAFNDSPVSASEVVEIHATKTCTARQAHRPHEAEKQQLEVITPVAAHRITARNEKKKQQNKTKQAQTKALKPRKILAENKCEGVPHTPRPANSGQSWQAQTADNH